MAALPPGTYLLTVAKARFETALFDNVVLAVGQNRTVNVPLKVGAIYGRGRWRKRKGIGTVRLANGKLRRVELHWYEAHGIGKRDFKIKSYLDE